YALAPEFWGNGYASEAVAAMLEAAFSLTRAIAINASVRVENPASRRVLEKARFRFVGTGREAAPARGGLVECDRFALGRADWAARPRNWFVSESVHEIS
ncbi:MAG: GNAT family protein, partial [Roseiarcus sp.]